MGGTCSFPGDRRVGRTRLRAVKTRVAAVSADSRGHRGRRRPSAAVRWAPGTLGAGGRFRDNGRNQVPCVHARGSLSAPLTHSPLQQDRCEIGGVAIGGVATPAPPSAVPTFRCPHHPAPPAPRPAPHHACPRPARHCPRHRHPAFPVVDSGFCLRGGGRAGVSLDPSA